jgi:hypothetical protein
MPTLLPREEYIVPFGLVLEYLPKTLKRALERTVRLQTVRETQIYMV